VVKVVVSAALCAGVFAVASAGVANFDTKAEGFFATGFVDGGVTFSNLDQYLGSAGTDVFAIDRADGDLGGFTGSGFSPLNVMTFGGWVPGTGCAFGRMGSFDFSIGGNASTASVDIFSLANDPSTVIKLQGKLGASVIQTVSVTVPNDSIIHHLSLSLPTGLYDNFHIVSSSPTNSGASFVNFDNVTVAPVPEPASMAVLGLGAIGLIRRRRASRA
jgi:hypothetical protein